MAGIQLKHLGKMLDLLKSGPVVAALQALEVVDANPGLEDSEINDYVGNNVMLHFLEGIQGDPAYKPEKDAMAAEGLDVDDVLAKQILALQKVCAKILE